MIIYDKIAAGKRLTELISDQKLNSSQFADKLGLDPSYLSKMESGKKGISASYIKKFEEFLNVNKQWLLFGTFPKYGTNVPHERQNGKSEKTYIDIRRDQKNSQGVFMVPLVPVKAQMGYAKSFNDPIFIDELQLFPIVPGVDYHGAVWRYFEVEGDSMLDTFRPGQYILASQVIREDWKNIENFYVYVVVTDDGVMVKRLAKVKGKDYWSAISDNEEDYPQFKLPVSSVKEVWKYRRHIDWDASPPKKFEIKV